MTPFAFILLLITGIAMAGVPRRWALLPLLIGACYMTGGQTINIGPFHFTVLRILLLIGFIRANARGERLSGGLKGMDYLVLLWGAWMVMSSVGHRPFSEALVFRLGSAYNTLGFYFLIRIFCRDRNDLVQTLKITAIVLAPVALEMIHEKITGRNMFGFLGGVPPMVMIRDGKLRAQGPFGHSILAGTVGALCVPLMAGIYRENPRIAKLGLVSCFVMVVMCTSSGPIMTAIFSLGALALWRWRYLTRYLRIGAVLLYIACDIVMTRPAYFLLEKIDLTGSSTGYHRAAIIDAGITHLNEWWLTGTDYTRHWMPYGVSWSPNHVDITNHYLFYGVDGGLLAMVLFIAEVWLGFRYVRQTLAARRNAPFTERFLIWALGSGLFAHAATMISIAYFDQSVMFLYLNLAAIASLHSAAMRTAKTEAAAGQGPSGEKPQKDGGAGQPTNAFSVA